MAGLRYCVTLSIILMLTTRASAEDDVITYKIDIATSSVLSVTEDEYLSVTLDFALKSDPNNPWRGLNFSNPRVHTLAKGLSPAILRFGGGPADTGIFYNATTSSEQQTVIRINKAAVDTETAFGGITAIFPDDIANLVALARSAGGRLLYDLNIELRYGPQWDSTNARALMRHFIDKNYHEFIDFELGNEPPYHKFSTAAFNATGERIAKDFLILKQVLNEFPEFQNSRLVGMDGESPRDGTYTGDQATVMRDFVKAIKHNITAVTAHHYYFNGPPAALGQFYNLTYFKYFESTLYLMRKALYDAAGGPIDIWIGESADSNQGGTPNITDSYASGFLWLDKLGIAAQNMIKLVARQSFYSTTSYNLLNLELYPNPDYWLSYVFKKLVGRGVLQTRVKSQFHKVLNSTDARKGLLRVYAHCASPRSGYPVGSITLFAVNINIHESARLHLPEELVNAFNSSLYLLTPEDNNLVSRNVQLNGKTLKMIDDYTFPELNPKAIATNDIKFPPLTFGFVVLQPKHNSIELKMSNICSHN